MLNNLSGWHFIIILFVVLLLFGGPKLPGLARSLGQSMKILKTELRTDPVNADENAHATPRAEGHTADGSGTATHP